MWRNTNSISEFVSREGRMELLEILVEKEGSMSTVAEMLGITESAIYGWKNERKRHPSNENVQKMIELLAQKNEREARRFLVEELQTFQELILEF